MAASHPPGTLPPPSAVATHPPARHGWPAEPYGGAPYHHVPDTRIYMHSGGVPPALPGHSTAPEPPPAHDARGAGGGTPLLAPVYVAPPKIEMQPWARKTWRWLADSTTGVARVDLRRPTPPLPEQYDGNILFVRSRQSVAKGGRFGGRRRGDDQPATAPQYTPPMYYTPPYPGVQQPLVAVPSALAGTPSLAQPLLMGARIKITRSFLLGGGRKPGRSLYGTPSGGSEDVISSGGGEAGSPSAVSAKAQGEAEAGGRRRRVVSPLTWSQRPLLDVGVGVNLDVDQQQIQPVARIKVKNLVSLKAAPMPLLKISRNIPLGPVALKVRYELPLAHASRFWEPPARLMVRLDNAVGSGVHLTASGIEFDEQVVRFGDAVSLRASAGLSFPRQLPLQEGEPRFRLQVHRLSLRSIW